MTDRQVLETGRNCWRVGHAQRASVLIDVADYFAAFAAVAEAAQRSIRIIGWDFNGSVVLRRSRGTPDRGETLGDFLLRLVERHPDLEIHILAWDFSVVYAPEREFLPRYRMDWRSHPRIHFELDANHSLGASHHQKIVVVDGEIAFVGGIDFAPSRWDTSAHRKKEPRRVNPSGQSYRPFHDVQMMVDGEAAEIVSQLIDERWRAATGDDLPAVESEGADLWPASVEVDLHDVQVGITRTHPDYGDGTDVREIEQLYFDCIERCERFLYLENQYFSAHEVGKRLAQRLAGDEAPELILVSRQSCSGWLEEEIMGTLRSDLMHRITRADRSQRFAAYHPVNGETPVDVHSKLMIVDDELLRVGSANLSNRSMGLDTECDLVIEAGGDSSVRSAIARVRHRLLADHLGKTPSEVEEAMRRSGSMRRAIDDLRGSGKSLEPLEPNCGEHWQPVDVEVYRLADPERPIEAELYSSWFAEEEEEAAPRRITPALALLGAALLGAVWISVDRAGWTGLAGVLGLVALAYTLWRAYGRD